MKNAGPKPTIYAYGFDKAGFTIPSETIEGKNHIIRFLGYAAEESLEPADGIIMPSGIFEELHSDRDYMQYSHRSVTYDHDHLARREKQVFQNYKRGGGPLAC